MKRDFEHTGGTPNPEGTRDEVLAWMGMLGQSTDHGNHLRTQSRLSGISGMFKKTKTSLTRVLGKYSHMVKKYAAAKKEVAARDQEIALLRTQLEQAKEQANINALTGLTNRRGAEASLDKEFRTILRYNTDAGNRQPQSLSVIFFDADHFKKVNDTYGHDAGDAVLKRIAELATSVFPRSDTTVARWGGEEFLVILPGDAAHAAMKAEELRRTVEKLCFTPETKGNAVTISVGVASYTPEPSDKHDIKGAIERLVKQADDAAYTAKKSGRNRVFRSQRVIEITPPGQHPTLQ